MQATPETTGIRIIVSGLTAAGKTTHCKQIAELLSVPYFSGSGLLSEMLGLPGHWTPAVDLARDKGAVDREVDQLMVSKLKSSARGVFDAWTLPWLTTEPAVRIWIESDQPSRVRKATVTELRRGLHPKAGDVHRVVDEKDAFSRRLFARLYGFDLFTDHEIFDLVLDNSQYIPRATIPDSDKGISSFGEVLAKLLLAHLSSSQRTSPSLDSL